MTSRFATLVAAVLIIGCHSPTTKAQMGGGPPPPPPPPPGEVINNLYGCYANWWSQGDGSGQNQELNVGANYTGIPGTTYNFYLYVYPEDHLYDPDYRTLAGEVAVTFPTGQTSALVVVTADSRDQEYELPWNVNGMFSFDLEMWGPSTAGPVKKDKIGGAVEIVKRTYRP